MIKKIAIMEQTNSNYSIIADYYRLDYLIMSTLLLRNASSEAPFNIPF